MRIALVNPIARRTEGYHTIGTAIPHLGLQVLANLVPAEHSVEIIDEIFGQEESENLLSPQRYDLVAVTAFSSGATRAYELAEICRRKGLPCIIGGPHASAVPEEASQYFDSVAVGECDEIWPGIIADAAAGRLQKLYQGRFADLSKGLGRAAQHIRPINGTYDVGCIQTSRGCPVGCDFCSVTKFNGPNIRRRPVDDIVEEWNSTTRKFLFVVDDNFFGVGKAHADWAKELLEAIIRRGKKRLWFSQTTLNMGDDREGMKLAYRAGCRGMLVGFESFNQANLKQFHKGVNSKNLDDYRRLIDGFHAGGISVFGGFIVGCDDDTVDVVADTALKASEIGIDIIQVTNLTPLPGTKMYDRWMVEGRIFAKSYPGDWERYTFVETVYNPNRMTAGELDKAICEIRYAAATENWVWKRTIKSLLKTRSISTALFVHGMNSGWARMARIQAPRDVVRFGAPQINSRTEKIHRSFGFNFCRGNGKGNGANS